MKVRWYFQGGLNLVSERNLFWNFASVYAPSSDFNSDETWLEGYVKPGVGFDKAFGNGSVFYGKLTGVAADDVDGGSAGSRAVLGRGIGAEPDRGPLAP